MANISASHVDGATFRVVVNDLGDIPAIDVTIDTSAIHATQAARLLRIGLENVIRDSWAGAFKKGGNVEVAGKAAKTIASLMSDEFTGGGGRGPKLTLEQRTLRDVLDEALEAYAAGKKLKLPKKESELQPMRDAWHKRYQADVDKEVARRIRLAQKSQAADVLSLEELMKAEEPAQA